MQNLRIFTLGRMALHLEGEALTDFVSQKTIALFVYLYFHPREFPRETLAEMFWAETSNEQALKNLRTVLSSLQKSLSDFLDVTRQTISIRNRETIWCDALAFEHALNSADHLLSPRRLRQTLETATQLYHGDFLPGLKTDGAPQLDQWLAFERDRLLLRFTDGLSRLVEVYAARGDTTAAIETGKRLLALEPFLEPLYQSLMKVYVQAGNRIAALQLYETLCGVLRDELDAEAEPETRRLYEQIKTGRLRAAPVTGIPNNLPRNAGRYVPDAALVENVQNRLDDPHCHLLTLTGIGGIGKTELARYIAQQWLEDYRDGVFFVSLESLTGAEFVERTLITALKVRHPDETQPANAALLDDLRDKHVLLVLDNFEHVLDAARWLAQIVIECPLVQVLVTSREQLMLAQEHVIPINGLTWGGENTPAIQLFTSTALQFNPDFDLSTHLPAINRICEIVDGLPLGILIAAGWTQFLTPEQIVTQIESNLEFLTLARRDLPQRHQGVIGLLASTWEALHETEREVLMALSVFPGHFDADAARETACADLSTLSALVAKSLITAGERYQLHELLRRFLYQKTVEAGRIMTMRRAHLNYYSAWIDRLHDAQLPSDQLFDAIDREYHNLWSFDWLPLPEQYQYILKLAKILPDYWIARDIHLQEGVELLRQALPEASGWLRANAYVRFGRLLAQVGEYKDARTVLEQGLTFSREEDDLLLETLALSELKRVVSNQGDLQLSLEYLLQMVKLYETTSPTDRVMLRETVSRAYSNLGIVYLQLAQHDEAERYALEGLRRHRDSDDPVGEALNLNTLGIIALDKGRYAAAREHFEAALSIAEMINHKRHLTIFSGNLAEAVHRLGDYDGALRLYTETWSRAYAMNNRKTMLNVIEQLANVLLDLNRPEQAARYLGAALALRETMEFALQPRQAAEFEAREGRLQETLGAEKLQNLIAVGRAWSLAQLNKELLK